MPVFNPKKSFILSGSNMNLTEKVSFGNEMVDPLYYMDTTGVSGLIPDAAFTDELTIETNDGVLELGE